MKKLIVSILSLFVFLAVVASKTLAYEGTIGLSGTGIDCQGSSVWHESRYRIIGRCEGLVYPYETQYEYYTIWGYDVSRDTYVRIDDVDRGYFEGDMNSAFDKVIITAEQDGGPRRPSDKTVASGSVAKFAFDKSKVITSTQTNVTTTTSTTDSNKVVAVQQNTNTKTASSSNVGSVVSRIITSLLVIILVVVGVVIAGSLLFRSRGSVSH